MTCSSWLLIFFFFNDTATTEIYTLSLHDALPISGAPAAARRTSWPRSNEASSAALMRSPSPSSKRSEEHTSELQSLAYLVCRLLLEKKKHIREDHCPHAAYTRSTL